MNSSGTTKGEKGDKGEQGEAGFIPVSFCKIGLTVDQSIPKGINTKIQFDNIIYDNNAEYDVINYLFKPKEAGYYHFTVHIAMYNGNIQGLSALAVICNGACINYESFIMYGYDEGTIHLSLDTYLQANDQVEIQITNLTNVSYYLYGSIEQTYLCIHRFA